MKKTEVSVFLIVALVSAISGIIFPMAKRDAPPPLVKGARTLYTGYVNIEHISFADIKEGLERLGCRSFGDTNKTNSPCYYTDASSSTDKVGKLIVYPDGVGFGPFSIIVTEDTIWDTEDIPGPPDPNKFQEAAGKRISSLSNVLRIKENSWKITETIYPWTVIY